MNEPGSGMKRTLLSRSALLFAIRFFPAAAMLAVLIAFSHFLPKDVNGRYQQLWMYLSVLTAVGCFGLPPLLLTHTPKSVHHWLLGLQARHVALFNVWLLSLATVLTAIFIHSVFGAWMLVALFLMQVWMLLAETYLIINRKLPALALLSFFYALLFCALHCLYLQSVFSFSALLWMIVLLGGAKLLVLTIMSRRVYVNETRALQRRRMSIAIRRQWLQLGIYDVSQVAFRFIDKVMISRMVGPALFSVYFIGTTDVPFMHLLLSAAGGGLLMQMASGDNSTAARLKLVNYSGAMLARIVFPVFFFLFFFRYEFIGVVFGKSYVSAVPLFAISVTALLLRAYNYTSILQHMNRVKIINLGAALDLGIALALSYPLFLWKGLPGVAFAFMISSYVQAVFYLAQTARLLRCSVLYLIPWRQWAVMLIVFGSIGIGLHNVLSGRFGLWQTLLLGFTGTAIIITIAVVPVVFSRKDHG